MKTTIINLEEENAKLKAENQELKERLAQYEVEWIVWKKGWNCNFRTRQLKISMLNDLSSKKLIIIHLPANGELLWQEVVWWPSAFSSLCLSIWGIPELTELSTCRNLAVTETCLELRLQKWPRLCQPPTTAELLLQTKITQCLRICREMDSITSQVVLDVTGNMARG